MSDPAPFIPRDYSIGPTIGEAPPELMRAYNAAVWLCANARETVRTLGMVASSRLPDDRLNSLLIGFVQCLDAEHFNGCSTLINTVAPRLTVVRGEMRRGPVRFGETTQPNAHLAARSFALETCRPFDLVSMLGPIETAIGEDLQRERGGFLRRALEGWERDGFATIAADIIAEAVLEATWAGQSRTATANWSRPFSIVELAKYYDVHRDTMSKRLKSGEIVASALGSRYMIDLNHAPAEVRKKLDAPHPKK